MKIIIGFLIFCLVLFIYLHIHYHLKTSNDLEIFHLEESSKDRLEDVCNLRQPVLFQFDNNKIIENTNKKFILNNYKSFEIKIRNTKENNTHDELFLPLPLHSSVKLFDEDKNSVHYSENNSDFLEETGIIKNLKCFDEFLRPDMMSNCIYDILFGSNQTTTPFRYEINYRNFFMVTQGSIKIKLASPQNIKYLYPNYDYENFEFSSPINPWNPEEKYKNDFDKVKCLDIVLNVGDTFFIPAYWWYSIKFNENSSVTSVRYRTYMNNLAILPYYSLYALQIQNIKRKITKKVSFDENLVSEIDSSNNDEIKTNNDEIKKTDI